MPGRVRVSVDADDPRRMVRRAVKALEPPEITEALESAAEVLQDGARTRAPKRSGALSRSIRVDRVGPHEVEVGTDIVYGVITEFGGRIRPNSPNTRLKFSGAGGAVFLRSVRIPAQPYMGPTFEQDSPRAVDAFADHIDRNI